MNFRTFLLTAMLVSSTLIGATKTSKSSRSAYEPPVFYCSNLPVEIDLTLALDDFRGIYTGSWISSFGALTALNLTVPLPQSFAIQLAGSYGLYDWAGRASTPYKNSKTYQQQGFITVAASWQTPHPSGFNAGVAYDWMLNKNFGLFATNPFFDQIRGQLGYLFCGSDEIGAWGAYGIRTVHETTQNVPLQFKGITQINLFWSHRFQTHGYFMLWAGSPLQRGLLYRSGRPGTFIVGTQFSVPVSESLSFDGYGSYMGARNRAGIIPSKNYGADLCFGITYAFGKRRVAKSSYMTLANNTNFMADTNQNY